MSVKLTDTVIQIGGTQVVKAQEAAEAAQVGKEVPEKGILALVYGRQRLDRLGRRSRIPG